MLTSGGVWILISGMSCIAIVTLIRMQLDDNLETFVELSIESIRELNRISGYGQRQSVTMYTHKGTVG